MITNVIKATAMCHAGTVLVINKSGATRSVTKAIAINGNQLLYKRADFKYVTRPLSFGNKKTLSASFNNVARRPKLTAASNTKLNTGFSHQACGSSPLTALAYV